MTRPFLSPALCLAGVIAALALGTGGAHASGLKLFQCQHGQQSLGFEAYDLHDISSSQACTVVRALVKYISNSSNPPIYKCGPAPSYKATLQLHSFEGWTLKLTPEFRMSKGPQSFGVSGTDFIACHN